MAGEYAALGGQAALSLSLGDPDVVEDSGVHEYLQWWQSNTCLFASLFPGVYPYLGRVANNYWRKRQTGENMGYGFVCQVVCPRWREACGAVARLSRVVIAIGLLLRRKAPRRSGCM